MEFYPILMEKYGFSDQAVKKNQDTYPIRNFNLDHFSRCDYSIILMVWAIWGSKVVAFSTVYIVRDAIGKIVKLATISYFSNHQENLIFFYFTYTLVVSCGRVSEMGRWQKPQRQKTRCQMPQTTKAPDDKSTRRLN